MSKIKDTIIEMQRLAHKKLCEREPEPRCEYCKDTGVIEKMGDGDNFEWDVVGYNRCECQLD